MTKRITVNLNEDEWGFIQFMAKKDDVTPQREMQMIFSTELWEMMQLDYYDEYKQERGE